MFQIQTPHFDEFPSNVAIDKINGLHEQIVYYLKRYHAVQ